MPALVLPKFPGDPRHRCVRPSVAEHETVRVSASQADSGSPMQGEGERCPSPTHSPILALPDLVLRANSSSVSAPLGDSDQAGPAFSASGQDLASSARDLEAVGMAHTGSRALMDNLPVKVQETIASARAPATRKLYSSKWRVFESWCLARAIDPVNCPVGPVLEFLQERLTTGAAATTLRVYVAAIAARRELDEVSLGRHQMVSAFMRGVRRLRPVRPMAVPSWDLSVVLEGLEAAPFELLESAPERILTLKVTLLLALTSLKRVGGLQVLSVSEMWMDFAPDLVKVTLRPRSGYIPKVLSTSFHSQVVTLHSFHPRPFASSEDERLHMLCPVRALKMYVDCSNIWRKSSQLLVCFGAGRRGLVTSKQRISHWVRDANSLSYEVRNHPLSLRAHSTKRRGLLSSSFQRGSPRGYLWSGRMVLSAHFCQVLQPGSWYGSGFWGSICLNQPYAVWFGFGSDRAAFLAWRVWYIVPKAWKAHAALSEPMTENISGYSRNPCSPNREREAAFAAKLLTLPAGIFSAEKSEEQMARSPV